MAFKGVFIYKNLCPLEWKVLYHTDYTLIIKGICKRKSEYIIQQAGLNSLSVCDFAGLIILNYFSTSLCAQDIHLSIPRLKIKTNIFLLKNKGFCKADPREWHIQGLYYLTTL
jgi:hypothetical protein